MCQTHRPPKPKHRSKTAQMREQKPQMPHVCKGPGQSCFRRKHAPTMCIQTCIVLAYAHSTTTRPSIPNLKNFKYIWAILQLSKPEPNSKEVKVRTQRVWSGAMEFHGGGGGHCNPWRAFGNHGNPCETNGNPKESIGAHRMLWETICSFGFHVKAFDWVGKRFETTLNYWTSIGINRSPWQQWECSLPAWRNSRTDVCDKAV